MSLELLKVLRDFQYPTLISTKGVETLTSPYLDVLSEMNVVVRFSASGVKEKCRAEIDRKCAPFSRTLAKLDELANRGVQTALRIQPLFPGSEKHALKMTQRSADVGVKQVSYEYLKLPNVLSPSELQRMSEVLGFDLLEKMQTLGLVAVGPDRALHPNAKRPFIKEARSLCHSLGIRFGAGDTEFIPWSDGTGCCGSSDLLLKKSFQFEANFVGAIKRAISKDRTRLFASDLRRLWTPSNLISPYLHSDSRKVTAGNGSWTDWENLVMARWNGDRGPYCPSFFDGVSETGRFDRDGFKIYDVGNLKAQLS